jgi:hypothetical protein
VSAPLMVRLALGRLPDASGNVSVAPLSGDDVPAAGVDCGTWHRAPCGERATKVPLPC